MSVKKRIKLKKPVILVLRIILIFFITFIGCFIFYRNNINSLKKLDYSEKASKNILFKFKKKYVLSKGSNATLNAAFESKYYNEDYLDSYSKIKYQNIDNLIKIINILIEKKYSNSDISLIISRGNYEDILEFSKKDKVRYLDEFLSFDYAKIKNYDRYVNYSDLTGEDEETVVLSVNLDIDKEAYVDPIIVKKYSYDMLVNKHRKLDEDFEPSDLVKINSNYASESNLKASKKAVSAFIKMADAASSEGYGIKINSAYRSYSDQEELCQFYRDAYGDDYVTKYVAFAGFSEHQTGLAFDIGSRSNNVFLESKEYNWMKENAYKYGFIQRFPKGYEDITGFRFESWHYRYVGEEIAKYIYEHKITFDEYYIMFLDK